MDIRKSCGICSEKFSMDIPVHDMSKEKNVEKFILIKKNGLSAIQMECGDIFHSVCMGSLIETTKRNTSCPICHHDFKLISSEDKRIVKFIDYMVKFTNAETFNNDSNNDRILWELPMTRDNYNVLVMDEEEDLLKIDLRTINSNFGTPGFKRYGNNNVLFQLSQQELEFFPLKTTDLLLGTGVQGACQPLPTQHNDRNISPSQPTQSSGNHAQESFEEKDRRDRFHQQYGSSEEIDKKYWERFHQLYGSDEEIDKEFWRRFQKHKENNK